MAQQDVLAVIRKAASDDLFRRALSYDFTRTIGDYNVALADTELEALKSVNWDALGLGGESVSTWVHIYKAEFI